MATFLCLNLPLAPFETIAFAQEEAEEEDDWIDWKVTKELMESWIGIRREVRT